MNVKYEVPRRMALLLPLLGWLSGCAARKPTDAVFFKGADAVLESAIRADDRLGVAKAIEAGASVNARGKSGTTPLMVAVSRRKTEAVSELLARGADPNAKAIDGHSAVSLAVENYKSAPDIFFTVMGNGGNPDIRRPDDDPVIMRFINDRNCEFIRHMKELGANLDIATRAGDPIITDAAIGADWDVVWCLMELGAKYNYETTSRRPLSKSLKGDFPSPDSPLFPYKKRVWELLKTQGIGVPPLNQ